MKDMKRRAMPRASTVKKNLVQVWIVFMNFMLFMVKGCCLDDV